MMQMQVRAEKMSEGIVRYVYFFMYLPNLMFRDKEGVFNAGS